MLTLLASGPLQTVHGEWQQYVYWLGYQQAIAMVFGDVNDAESVLCRIHSSCVTAHVFMSVECDCREQLSIAMRAMQQDGKGVVVWLDQEGRGHGMSAHIQTQNLKRGGLSQTEAYRDLGYDDDARDYSAAPKIFQALGVRSITLLTNNLEKLQAVTEAGIPAVLGQESLYIDVGDNELLRDQYKGKIADGHTIELEPR